MALGVRRVRHGRCAAAPDGGAARGVGDHHAVAEELRDELGVRRLAAAGAGAGELDERLLELAANDRLFLHRVLLRRDFFRVDAVVEVSLLCLEVVVKRRHVERLDRADLRAVAAAEAVHRGDSHREVVILDGADFLGREALRCCSELFVRREDRADGSVRADIGALVAADALLGVPDWHVDGRAALLVGGAAERVRTVGAVAGELRDRQLVAFLAVHDLLDLGDELRQVALLFRCVLGVSPRCRYLDLVQGLDALVDGAVVHVDDVLALAAVRGDDGFLEVRHSRLDRDDVRELEERGLHDHVEAAAEAEALGNRHSVDRVELDLVLGDVALHGCRQMLRELLVAPDRVEEERAALLEAGEQVVLVDVRLLRAGDEVGLVDEVRARDRGLAEAQVRHRDAARLLGVIGEVRLGVHVRLVADDLDRALVGADRAVGAEAPELAGRRAFRREVDIRQRRRQARVRDIVVDADREAVLRRVFLEFFKDGEDLVRRRVLAAEAEAAADDRRVHVGMIEGCLDVEVERLAERTRLLCVVEDGDFLDGLRQELEEVLDGERTVEVYVQEADLLPLRVEVVDRLLDRLADGAHGDDDAVGILRAVVVEEMVLAARDLREVSHGLLDELWQRIVEAVGRFTRLEVDVRVRRGAAQDRVVRVQRAATEGLDGIPVEKLCEVFVVDRLDLLDLVRRAEAVEEVDERHAALDGDEMCDDREVHDLLDARLGEHGAARLACGHDILVVAEDVQGVGSECARGDVKDARQQLAGYLVEIRDHQQEALGSRVRRRQCTGLQRAVHSAGSAGLGLQLDDLDLLAEEILRSLGSHFIYMLSHRRGRRDRVNRRDVGESIGDVGGSCVAVHGFHLFAHVFCYSPLILDLTDGGCPPSHSQE